MKFFRRLFVLAALVLLQGSVFAQARYAIIHNFAGGANDGANPQGDVTVSGSICYGMTLGGGRNGLGTVFKCNTDGTGFQILHSFSLDSTDGRLPFGSLTLSGTTLYGMTGAGGSNNLGMIFKINTDGTGFAILHSFAGSDADGAHPYGSLTVSGTTLYGMTYGGGSATVDLHWQTLGGVEATVLSADQGTVFKINTDGTGFTLLHSFSGATWVNLEPPDHSPEFGYASQDGAFPYGSLVLSGSTLYGMTSAGGGGNLNMSPGTIFSINTDGTGYAVLHPLQGFVNPLGSLSQSGSTLYGTTRGFADVSLLGVGSGIFRINTDGTNLATLYGPTVSLDILQGSLTQAGSVLYGRTSGATADSVFQINPDGTGFVLLQSLPARATANPGTQKWLSQCSLTLSGSTLYGMTSSGGAQGDGMIFCLVLNAAWITAQPSSQTVVIGANATFSVVTGGPPPLAYQWQRVHAGSNVWADLSDGTTYSGTSTATLTVNSATAVMNGDLFRCVATNSYGYDTSSTAVLVVPTPLTVSTVAGQGGHSGGSDGSGSAAQFFGPTDVATDSAGNVYIADTDNHTIRKMTPAGVVSTVAGYAGTSGSANGTATVARFNHPSGVTVDSTGNVYVTDTDNNAVRKITSAGIVSTMAGAVGTSGSVDGTGTAARFYKPSGIVADTAGNLYVADTLNHTIRKVTPAGLVSTFAGAAGTRGSIDDVGTAARFYGPQGLAFSSAGTPILYVADANNSTIRKVTVSTGSVVTWAGLAGATGSADGPGNMAQFYYPCGVTVDSAGNLYVADTDNHTIRVVTLLGEVTTIAGKVGTSGSADGVGDAARFNHPTGLAVDSTGNLYVADADNDTIRLGYLPAAPTITTQPQSQTVITGNNVQFTLAAIGQPAPTYQWNFNGTAISGATSSSLSLTNVQTSSAGDYTAIVSNTSGSVTSNKATLTVNAPAPPPSGGGGGGGTMEPWFAAALLLLEVARRTRQGKLDV